MALLCLAAVFLNRPMPGSAQGVAGSNPAKVVWDQSRFDDVDAGYQSLQWNPIENAVRYEVVDGNGDLYYEGGMNEAFVSGLPDGEHLFDVRAFAADGTVIGVSEIPAVVMVDHWPLSWALVLLAIGALVFVAMVLAITIGSVRASRESDHVGANP